MSAYSRVNCPSDLRQKLTLTVPQTVSVVNIGYLRKGKCMWLVGGMEERVKKEKEAVTKIITVIIIIKTQQTVSLKICS